jgi:hypothetical protein
MSLSHKSAGVALARRRAASIVFAVFHALGLSFDIYRPRYFASFVLASSSILSLLIYFSGWMSMAQACGWLLVPSIGLLGLLALGRGEGAVAFRAVLARGLWAGSFATLAYDLVRMPLAHAGAPVFKAISYFGTLLLNVPRPTMASEIVGWSYHLSNGLGFAVMYALLFARASAVTAVVWGVLLEVLMLLTPYAEIFGYGRSAGFIAVSMGAHVCYGLGLWASMRYLSRRSAEVRPLRTRERGLMAGAWMAGPVALALIAADFHNLHASSIPTSPPSDLGPDLYVTWNVPEVDRIGAIWLMRRWVNPRARFYFVKPMSRVAYGIPFDLPEAEIRRSYALSTFETTLRKIEKENEPAMVLLARMCHRSEMQSWLAPSSGPETGLLDEVNRRLAGCRELDACLDQGMAWFDETYARLSRPPSSGVVPPARSLRTRPPAG